MLCWWCWLDWSTRVSEWVSAEAWKPPSTWQLECWKCSHNCLLFFFYLKIKNLLDTKWLCQSMFLCPTGCTSVSSSFQYWTGEDEAAMDKANLCRQDGGMSHMGTCARGRRCWAQGATWTGASGLLQGQYQHKKKKNMQSLEAMQGFLLMEMRFWVPRVAFVWNLI